VNRRHFLKAASAIGAGLTILPSGARAGKNAPGNKLNIALIGVWGRALAHYDSLADENVVALCDVNEARFPDALKAFPKAKTYVDWRQCLDQKDLDAVVCCTGALACVKRPKTTHYWANQHSRGRLGHTFHTRS
jgi:hypothetical protein